MFVFKEGTSIYAIVETGGKQHRVSAGDTIKVELLEGEPSSQVELDRVLLASDGKKTVVGTPLIKGARVTAIVNNHGKGKKITVFRYKSKVRHSSKIGHRQPFTSLTVNSIEVPELAKKTRKKAEEQKEENQDGA